MRCSPFFMTHTVLEWHGSAILTSIWEVYILYCIYICGSENRLPPCTTDSNMSLFQNGLFNVAPAPIFRYPTIIFKHTQFGSIPRIIPFNRTKSDGNVRIVRATQGEVSAVPEFPRPHRPGSDGSEMIGDIVGNGIVYTLKYDIYMCV